MSDDSKQSVESTQVPSEQQSCLKDEQIAEAASFLNEFFETSVKSIHHVLENHVSAGLKLCFDLRPKCCRQAALGFKVLPKSAQKRRKEPNIKTVWIIIIWSKTAETGKKQPKNTGKRAKIGCIQEKTRHHFERFLLVYSKLLPGAAQNVLPNVNGGSKSLRPDSVIFAARKKQFLTPDSDSKGTKDEF